jgi:hypothetical protein
MTKGALPAVLTLAALLGVGACSVAPHFDRDTYTATVTEKQVKRNGDNDRYLVFTKVDGDTRIFENTDSLLEGKFRSSDFQAEIEVGQTYELDTYGWRVPFFSWYENIVDYNVK